MSEAYRAGQLKATTEADSVIDEAQRALVLVEDDGGPRLRGTLAAWKASLADAIRDEAVYLTEALLRWEALRNLSTNLASIVRFDITDLEPLVLSRSQGRELWEHLWDQVPRGTVRVDVLERGWGLPGQAVTLRIGKNTVFLAADPMPISQIDLAPITLAYAAVMVGLQASYELGSVPPVLALAGSGSFVSLAWWAHRHLAPRGPEGRRWLALWCELTALVYSAAASRMVRRTCTSAGQLNFPAAGLLQGVVATLVALSPSLSRGDQWAAGLGAAFIGAVGWCALPVRPPMKRLVFELAWPITTMGTGLGIAHTIDSHVSELLAALDRRMVLDAQAAHRRGYEWVVALCEEIVAAADERLDHRMAGNDEDPIYVEACRRIQALRTRLENYRVVPCVS